MVINVLIIEILFSLFGIVELDFILIIIAKFKISAVKQLILLNMSE